MTYCCHIASIFYKHWFSLVRYNVIIFWITVERCYGYSLATAVQTAINSAIKRFARRPGDSFATNINGSGEITPSFGSTFSAFIYVFWWLFGGIREDNSSPKMFVVILAILRLPTSFNWWFGESRCWQGNGITVHKC